MTVLTSEQIDDFANCHLAAVVIPQFGDLVDTIRDLQRQLCEEQSEHEVNRKGFAEAEFQRQKFQNDLEEEEVGHNVTRGELGDLMGSLVLMLEEYGHIGPSDDLEIHDLLNIIRSVLRKLDVAPFEVDGSDIQSHVDVWDSSSGEWYPATLHEEAGKPYMVKRKFGGDESKTTEQILAAHMLNEFDTGYCRCGHELRPDEEHYDHVAEMLRRAGKLDES